MLQRPSIRDPSGFSDIFWVLLAVVLIIGLLSVVVEDDTVRDISVILVIVVFGWVSWAIHNILERHTGERDDPVQ